MRTTKKIKHLFLLILFAFGFLSTRAQEENCSFTWDLTTNSYSSASTSEVVWSHNYVKLKTTKGRSSYDSPDKGLSYIYTKFFAENSLSISPAKGFRISHVVFTLTESKYSDYLISSQWSNGIAEKQGSTVTVTAEGYGDVTVEKLSNTVNVQKVEVFFASYSRSGLQDGDYATICLPSDVASVENCGAEFYNIEGVETNSSDQITSIVLSDPLTSLEAGKPYIFKATADKQELTFSAKLLTEPISNAGLVGNLSRESLKVPDGCYIIGNDNKLHKINGANATVGQCRAYVDLSTLSGIDGNSGNARIAIEGASDIQMINEENVYSDIYDLSGHKLSNHSFGFSIKDRTIIFKK